jgi:hypothetical protein
VGGVYRDQGAEVVSKWLMSLLRPHVKVAYQSVRKDYLLPPVTEAPSPVEASTSYNPSPFSSTWTTSLEGAGAAFPSYLPGFPRDHRQLTPPEASVPQQSSAQEGDGVGTRRAVNDRPRGRRRRRRSSLKDVGRGDTGEQGTFSPRGLWIRPNESRLISRYPDGTLSQPRSSMGLVSTDSARKRQRAEGRNDG